jgi:hypothetical protein
MKSIKKYKIALATLLMSSSILANAAPFWRCTAFNGRHNHSWSATRSIRGNAVHDALTLCKINARRPRRCNIGISNCVRVYHPRWRRSCLVLDRKGRRWRTRGVNACSRALANCRGWHRRNRASTNWACHVARSK